MTEKAPVGYGYEFACRRFGLKIKSLAALTRTSFDFIDQCVATGDAAVPNPKSKHDNPTKRGREA